jgi:multidrug efflux pump subunit AcrB
VITVGAFSLISTLNTDLFSAEDFSYFTIDISTPIGSPISTTDRVVQQFEEVLLAKIGQGEIVSISSSVGSSASSITGSSSNLAEITVDLYEMDEGRTRSIDTIIEEIKKETYFIAGADQVFYRKAQNGPPSSAPLGYRLSGDNYTALIEASEDIMSYLDTIEKVNTIESDYQKGSPELRIRLNEDRASALGISVSTLGSFVRSRFEGINAGIFFEDNKEVPIIVRTDYKVAAKYADLEQSLIPTADGRLVPFSSVASIELGSSFGSIKRVEGKREIQVSADIEEGVETNRIDEMVSNYWDSQLSAKYQGIEFSAGGDFAEFSSLLFDILRVFLLGIFLIYLILGAQFNSYTQPLLILLSVPFAFIGVILYLFFSGTPFSTTVIYAGVALAGIAVNDAIVLISFVNELRQKGTQVKEAVIEAAKQRIRPILLTSLTTIGGLLPTAIGIGGKSVVWGPMASTIMFGLIFSTLSALFVIPLLFGLLYDRKSKQLEGSAV